MKRIRNTLIIFIIIWIAFLAVSILFHLGSIYPISIIIYLLLFSWFLNKPITKYLRTNYPAVHKELTKMYPMVNGFAWLNFAFGNKYNEYTDIKEIKFYCKLFHLSCFIIFVSMTFSGGFSN